MRTRTPVAGPHRAKRLDHRHPCDHEGLFLFKKTDRNGPADGWSAPVEVEVPNRPAEVGRGTIPVDGKQQVALDVQIALGVDAEMEGTLGRDLETRMATEKGVEDLDGIGTEGATDHDPERRNMLAEEPRLVGEGVIIERPIPALPAIEQDGGKVGWDGLVLVEGVQQPSQVITAFRHVFPHAEALHGEPADVEDEGDLGMRLADFDEHLGIGPNHVQLKGIDAG